MNLGYVVLGYGGTAAAVAFGALAVWRGGWQERSAVFGVLAGWFVTPLVQTTFRAGLPLILLDAAEVVGLFTISFYSRRVWSALITACVAADLVSHVADNLAPHDHRTAWAYVVTADFLGGIFVALCFAAAAWESAYLRKKACGLRNELTAPA